MSTFNLIRNSRVFFTTNINATTKEVVTGSVTPHTSTTTVELQVMDGFTFSQATNADTITLSEAGNNPVRGQRSFNTSLGNVEFSFSTYVRPKLASGLVSCEERVLWNALLSDQVVTATPVSMTPASSSPTVTAAAAVAGTSGNRVSVLVASSVAATVTVGRIYNVTSVIGAGASKANNPVKVISCSATTLVLEYLQDQALTGSLTPGNWTTAKLSSTAWNEYLVQSADTAGPTNSSSVPVPYATLNTALSNKNQLQPFGMIMVVDNATYLIDNCAMDQAVLDFGLDGIAMIAWTGKGTALRSLADVDTVTFPSANNFGSATNSVQGAYLAKDTTAQFITNKLSTVALNSTIFGAGSGAASYTLALTGGSVTIANGITFVTPANLGIVNKPIGYFTGTRAVTGSLTAYLRTGSLGTADLLRTMLAGSSTDTDPEFKVLVSVGGASNGTKVDIEIPAAMVQIPTIDAQAVMSTNITFTGQGHSFAAQATAAYDIESPSEINIKYFAA
jgi:hypothetical protein